MKNVEKEDIIDNLITSLKNYNENYVEGLWENFLEKRKRKKRKKRKILVIQFVSGIAASLLVGYLSITAIRHAMEENHDYNAANSDTNKIQTEEITPMAVLKSRPDNRNLSAEIIEIPVENNQNIVAIDTSPEIKYSQVQVINPDSSVFNNEKNELIVIDKTPNGFQEDRYHSQNTDISDMESVDNSTVKKFSIGFVVNEAINSTAMSSNISYAFGIVNDVRLSHNISLNTGIIFGKYNLDYTSNTGTFGIPNDEPISTGVELVCFDIPLNLKIKLKEMKKSNIFITSGVSTLVFIRESYNQQFLFEEPVTTTYRFENINFSGQFNLSFGWQYKIFKETHISIETYTKLPLYKLAENNLVFYQTGFSLRISN